jgi:dTMP kinase
VKARGRQFAFDAGSIFIYHTCWYFYFLRKVYGLTAELRKKLAGKFIVLDGPDGCGKSTLTKLLCRWLEDNGQSTVSFRDPGDTEVGEKIREILLDPANSQMDTRTELLLYMAARAQLWKERISPALDSESCVVLDRWLSSTCAYQGYAGGLGIEKIEKLAESCLERVWPDLTVICDLDIETASSRLKSCPDRMEQKGREYHIKVREGFLKLASGRADFVVIQSAGEIETVHQKIVEAVKRHFNI